MARSFDMLMIKLTIGEFEGPNPFAYSPCHLVDRRAVRRDRTHRAL
jgi:hypothetical protein